MTSAVAWAVPNTACGGQAVPPPPPPLPPPPPPSPRPSACLAHCHPDASSFSSQLDRLRAGIAEKENAIREDEKKAVLHFEQVKQLKAQLEGTAKASGTNSVVMEKVRHVCCAAR